MTNPIIRRRLYETGVAVLGLLVVWGIFTADEVAQMVEALDKLLGIGLLLMARRHVADE